MKELEIKKWLNWQKEFLVFWETLCHPAEEATKEEQTVKEEGVGVMDDHNSYNDGDYELCRLFIPEDILEPGSNMKSSLAFFSHQMTKVVDMLEYVARGGEPDEEEDPIEIIKECRNRALDMWAFSNIILSGSTSDSDMMRWFIDQKKELKEQV